MSIANKKSIKSTQQ